MESLDRLQAELQGNVNPSAYERLYNLTQLASIEHGELMAQAMKWVRKEKLEPLEAENAKLRELVSEMFRGFVNCDLQLREHGRTFLAYTRYNDRLRELGIEVDE